MKIGSLFSGVAGLDRAVEAVTGATPAWFVEFDKAPSKVLARQYPDVPNYGDVTAVEWSEVEPIDILTGGFPCQDLSIAGKRKGLRPGTRSGLWEHMSYAIDALQPRLVVIENVRGLLSAEAHSNMEPCAWCLGDESDSYMRALGAVLADLADLGYDARWCGIRASDAGAPHLRFRVFIIGFPARDAHGGHVRDAAGSGQGIPRGRRDEAGSLDEFRDLLLTHLATTKAYPSKTGFAGIEHQAMSLAEGQLVPTPLAAGDSTSGHPNYLPLGDAVRELLPTPITQSDKTLGGSARAARAWPQSPGYRPSLGMVAQELLPTPTPFTNSNTETPEEWTERRADVVDRTGTYHGLPLSVAAVSVAEGEPLLQSDPLAPPKHYPSVWGPYAQAIQTWENITGEEAPAPTTQDANGRHRLNPELPRWMMGFPPGWLDGLTQAQKLKAAGNAVCQQQAELALRIMLGLS